MDHLYLRAGDVPAELCEHRRFLPWQLRERKKVPLDRYGHPCNADDPANWQDLSDASQQSYYAGEGPRGIGYALRESGIVVLDFDRCIDEQTGAISPDVQPIVDLFGSATELSPSGRGLHVLIAGTMPEGNRRVPGMELLGSGFMTVTGHPQIRAPIREGGERLHRLIAELRPKPSTLRPGQIEPLPVASRTEIETVLASAMPNARFRKLLRGDWSEYDSPSEADAAFCMHLARNGGSAGVLIACLRESGLRRPKLRRDDYVMRQAAFVLATAEVRVPQWHGVTLPAQNDPERRVIERLQTVCASGLDAVLLQRIAREIVAQANRGQCRDDGTFRVSPQNLAGDFAPRAGLPVPDKIMSSRGCRKALKRLAAAGVFDLFEAEDQIVWYPNGKRRTRQGKVTLLRISGTDVVSILTGFADRLSTAAPEQTASPTDPPVYVLGTHFHNTHESVENGVAA